MLTKHGQIPTRGSAGAAGFDVYAAHPSEIRPGCRRVVQLDIALSISAGFYAQLQPRSGLAKNKCIDVAAGVIDSDFRENIGVLLVNNGTEKYMVSVGDRIAQLLFKPVAQPEIQEVAALPPSGRGAAGFGSTGVEQVQRGVGCSANQVAAHSACTCCYKGENQQASRPICMIRVCHGMTHDQVRSHEILTDSEELEIGEVQLPACNCRVPPASSDEGTVRGVQQKSGFQVPPDCFAGGWGLTRGWGDQNSETVAPEDTPAGCPNAQVSKLSRVPAAPTTASERLQIRRSAHRKKVQNRLSLLPSARRQFIQWAHKTNGEDPQVVTDFFDVFAQNGDRPMSQPWTGKCFFLHPRPEELKDTVGKILLDGTKGILVLPVWKNMPHFWSVGEVAIDWWDCPPEMPIYQGAKPRLATRVVLFDELAALDMEAGMDRWAGVQEDEFSGDPESVDPPPRCHMTPTTPPPEQLQDPDEPGVQSVNTQSAEAHSLDESGRGVAPGERQQCRQRKRRLSRQSGKGHGKTAGVCSPSCSDIDCSGEQAITSEAPYESENQGVQQSIQGHVSTAEPKVIAGLQQCQEAAASCSDLRHLPRRMRRRLLTRTERDRLSQFNTVAVSSSDEGPETGSPGRTKKCRKVRSVILQDTPPGQLRTGIHGRSIRSVIEADMTDPNCSGYREALEKEFEDVLKFKSLTPEDIENKIRGPYTEATITLKKGAEPKSVQPFRCLGVRAAAFKALLDKFSDRGMIKEAEGNPLWIARAFVVPKPGGKWRLVIDYRHLNDNIENITYLIPIIEDRIVEEGKNALWSIFDLEDGFHQMPLSPDSRHLTSFTTPWGVFEWQVLPMGLKTSPSQYQRMVSYCLDSIKLKPYIDDVLKGTPRNIDTGQVDDTVCKQHDIQLREVFTLFRKYKLTVKRTKMHLFVRKVKFCGHILCNGQRMSSPEKRAAIEKWRWEDIRTPKHLKSFLGLTQWYAIYMRNYAKYAGILSEALRKLPEPTAKDKGRSSQRHKIVWTREMKRAFSQIKRGMSEDVILDIADVNKKFITRVDASDYAVGAVLEQYDSKNQLRPVAFYSRKLAGDQGDGTARGQRDWSTREKEMYGIISTLHKHQSWIGMGTEVEILTDYRTLEKWYHNDLLTVSGPLGRRGRWHEFLSRYP